MISGDYIALQRVTFPFFPDDQFTQIRFELIQDRLPEDDEEFSIELTSLGVRVVIGQPGGPFSRATIVIIDDDG